MSENLFPRGLDRPVTISFATAGDDICHIEENGNIIRDGKIINNDVNALAACMLELARNHAQQFDHLQPGPDSASDVTESRSPAQVGRPGQVLVVDPKSPGGVRYCDPDPGSVKEVDEQLGSLWGGFSDD